MTPEEIKEYNRIRMGNVLETYTPDTLPTYDDCRTLLFNEQYRKKNGDYKPEGNGILDRYPTELERYIYEETPSSETADMYFRERLSNLLNWHRHSIVASLPVDREVAGKIFDQGFYSFPEANKQEYEIFHSKMKDDCLKQFS